MFNLNKNNTVESVLEVLENSVSGLEVVLSDQSDEVLRQENIIDIASSRRDAAVEQVSRAVEVTKKLKELIV